jgi:hypothetical protein
VLQALQPIDLCGEPNLIKLLWPVLIAVCALQTVAEAAVITSLRSVSLPGSSTGTVGPVGATPSPNNDNAIDPSPNTIPYSVFLNTPGTLETEFLLQPSGGTTEYRITQQLVNNTGLAWQGFVFELGFGTGSAFIRSTLADELDFDASRFDPGPVSPAFPFLDATPDRLAWSGATVGSIGSATFSLALDVPDGLQAFTLRQIPVGTPVPVPEPAPGALLVLVMAGLAFAICAGMRNSRSGRIAKSAKVGFSQA